MSYFPSFDPGFPVATEPFDQKNEMFKRSCWDDRFLDSSRRFYKEVVLNNRPGWGQPELSALNASWSLDMNFTSGIGLGNMGLYSWKGPSGRAEDYVAVGGRFEAEADNLSCLVKSAALQFGANLVGICQIHPSWVYSHEYNRKTGKHKVINLPEGVDKAVVMAVEMNYHQIKSKSLVLRSVAVGLGYSSMAHLANQLAIFIRGLGYTALPAGNDTALSIPMAMAAGLGEQSRMGLLVTKKFGPRIRLCKVLTDMPVKTDKYHPFGVGEFCRTCEVCAKKCPSQSIPYGPPTESGKNISNQSGPLKWYNDHERCFNYWASIRTDCSQCIRVCPFNKPLSKIHDLSRFMIRFKWPLLNKALVQLDSILGYHSTYPASVFWNESNRYRKN